MTSDPASLFVWIWLPGELEPVVCGRLDDEAGTITFTYARSYLERSDAVAVYGAELPLERGAQQAAAGRRLPLCIDDAMPDSWGRQVVNYRLGTPTEAHHEFTYLRQSGSDRIGALDFQDSPELYEPRGLDHPDLDDLAEAARRIQAGEVLSDELATALLHGSSVGGARPKALINTGDRRLIAKFSSSTDVYPVVQGEFVAMTLAARCGLQVAPVELQRSAGRHALLVERFDRDPGGSRRRVVSALTILGLDTFPGGRYATYVALADRIRSGFTEPAATLAELFGRISFNILSSNTDDHGRNHAAFVGGDCTLTPAYDICPQARTGETAAQAMAFTRGGDGDAGIRESNVAVLVDAAHEYLLERRAALDIVESQIEVISTHFDEVCDAAELTAAQRQAFWGTQFLNPAAVRGLPRR
jgi:serine/threonine-protein kinase HipA